MSLRFDNVTAQIGAFRLDADFDVATLGITAVIGPSGSGKSTLLGALTGFVPLSQGRILWDGHDVGALPPAARPVAILFQDQNLFPHLRVGQNLGLGLRPDLRLSRDDHRQIEAALDLVGLPGMAERLPAELSGGQQSRVALARASLQAKPVLALDEAFSALGPALKTEMLDLVARLQQDRGLCVLMVTHDPDDAARIARDTIVVMDGKAAAPVPTRPLLADPPAALARYLG